MIVDFKPNFKTIVDLKLKVDEEVGGQMLNTLTWMRMKKAGRKKRKHTYVRNKGKCCLGGHSLIKGKMGSLGGQCLGFQKLMGRWVFFKIVLYRWVFYPISHIIFLQT